MKAFFADRHFISDLVRLALPIALANLINSSVNMLDTIMVGRLGSAELAAVGLANQIFFLLILILFGVSTGAGVFISQFWGKRDIPGIRRSTGLSLTIGMAVGLAFMTASLIAPRFILGLYSKDREVVELGARYLRLVALSYPLSAASFIFSVALRGVERVRMPLVATIIALSINAILNYALIFGKFGFPALGVEGAALATVVSRVVEFAIIVASVYARKTPPAGSLRELLSWQAGFVSRYIKIASPVVLNEFAWALGMTVYSGVFARVGTDAIAAYSVTSTVSQLAGVFFLGTANAAAVMIGKRIGEGDRDTAFLWAKRFAVMAPVLGLVMSALLVPASLLLPLLFSISPEALRQAMAMVVALAFFFPFKVFNLHAIVGICRAGGDTKFGALFDILGVWGLGVPLAALSAFLLGAEPWVIFIFINFEEAAKSFVGMWRLGSRKWLNDVTA